MGEGHLNTIDHLNPCDTLPQLPWWPVLGYLKRLCIWWVIHPMFLDGCLSCDKIVRCMELTVISSINPMGHEKWLQIGKGPAAIFNGITKAYDMAHRCVKLIPPRFRTPIGAMNYSTSTEIRSLPNDLRVRVRY